MIHGECFMLMNFSAIFVEGIKVKKRHKKVVKSKFVWHVLMG